MSAKAVDGALSLGWRTDLIFARFDGQVTDCGKHVRVRTPANPTFWWGNLHLRTLVMVADPDDVAIGVYESLGYRRGVSAWQLERAPR